MRRLDKLEMEIRELALGQGYPEKEKNMPYVERITRAGKTIEVERYFSSRYKKQGIKRGDKVKPTTEQQKINTRQAERKLRILINANFVYGDYHLVLDYIRRKGEPPRTKEQMRQDMDIFLREYYMERKERQRQAAIKRYADLHACDFCKGRHFHTCTLFCCAEPYRRAYEYAETHYSKGAVGE